MSKTVKRAVVVFLAVICVVGMAVASNAMTATVGANNLPNYYDSSYPIVPGGSYRTALGSVSFNGLPSNTWPTGGKINFAYYKSNGSTKGGFMKHTSSYTKSNIINFTTDYLRRGGSTNYTSNCTVGVDFLSV